MKRGISWSPAAWEAVEVSMAGVEVEAEVVLGFPAGKARLAARHLPL